MKHFSLWLSIIVFSLCFGLVFSASAATFTSDFGLGARSNQVLSLQRILNADPSTQITSSGSGSPGQETNYFGSLTKRALQKFQAKYGISTTGFVGPLTRAKLNTLSTSGTTSTNTVSSTSATTFARNLGLGMSGTDILVLQRILNSDTATRISTSGAGSPGQESTYFGNLTRQALIRFQTKYGIDPTGYVGTLTRQVLNRIVTGTTNTTTVTTTGGTAASGTGGGGTSGGTAPANTTGTTGTGTTGTTGGGGATGGGGGGGDTTPTTPATTIPGAPTSLAVSVISSTQLTISWTDNATNETGFVIERKIGSGAWSEVAIVNANVLSYANTGLTPSTSYTYRVKAVNSAGSSGYTTEVTNTTQAGSQTPTVTLPGAPTSLAVSVISSTQLTISWTDNATNETSFIIERKIGSGAWSEVATVNANVLSYANTGLTPSTSYTYRVKAVNSAGSSGYTTEVTNTTQAGAVTPPVVVTPGWQNQSITAQTGTFTIEFDATPTQVNQDVVIGLSDGSASLFSQLAAIVRFTNGTVEIRNGSTYSSLTSYSYSVNTSYHVEMVINIPTHTYSVYITRSGGTRTLLASNYAFRTDQSSVSTLNTLAKYNELGDAPLANISITASQTPSTPPTTPSVTIPSAPTNLSVSVVSTSQLNLSWTDASTNETGFKIERRVSGGSWSEIATVGANVTSYQNTGLTASTQYFYRIRATNSAGDSSYSSEANGTTQANVVVNPPVTPPAGGVGSDALAIARFDVVPYQTFSSTFNVGVVAFHMNGINRVEFRVNGGSPVSVTQMTLNPQTNVVEYWTPINPANYPDGAISVQATAYPTNGVARTLDPLPLNVNANGTLPSLVRYVSPSGNDATGDGTAAKPFGTIMKAARSIQDMSGIGTADGGTIYLTPGDHVYGTYSYSLYTNTSNRWLTITPAPGVSRSQVRLVQNGNSTGLNTKLVQLKNVTIQPTGSSPTIITSGGPLQDYVWLDNCRVIGLGRTAPLDFMNGWSDQYITDCEVSDSMNGLSGSLVRNVYVHDIGSDAFSGGGLVVNSTVVNINNTGTDFHPDVYQSYPSGNNIIIYGLTATQNILSQGLFAGNNIPMTDIAFVNCEVNNQSTPTVFRVFQFAGPTNHMYVKNCNFVGPSNWRTDINFTAHNVVVENSHFSEMSDDKPSPSNVSGVTYR